MDKAIIPYEPSKVLGKKTPKTAIYKRPGPGGMSLSYVPWAWVARRMNEAFGSNWSLRYIADPKIQGGEVLVMVEVATPEGSQQAYGSHKYQQSNPNASYGDALQSATSKALRRACARWGVALDLYLGADDDLPEDAAEIRAFVIIRANELGKEFASIEFIAEKRIESGQSPLDAWATAAEELEK